VGDTKIVTILGTTRMNSTGCYFRILAWYIGHQSTRQSKPNQPHEGATYTGNLLYRLTLGFLAGSGRYIYMSSHHNPLHLSSCYCLIYYRLSFFGYHVPVFCAIVPVGRGPYRFAVFHAHLTKGFLQFYSEWCSTILPSLIYFEGAT